MKANSILTALSSPALALAALFAAFSPNAFARGSMVTYTPVQQAVEGVMPFTYTQALTVTSPADLPAGSSVVIGFRVDATSFSTGTADQALKYVSLSPSTLTFTDPNQALTVDVTVSVPALALGEDDDTSSAANFQYLITATGWPTASANYGATVQVKAKAPTSAKTAAPTVQVGAPADQSSVSFLPEQMPGQVPFQFQATGSDSAPITAVDADCGDNAVVTLTSVTGLGTAQVTASGTISVQKDKHFELTARATNSGGTAKAQNQFTVVVSAPPPVVAFTNPLPGATLTYRTGSTPLAVPVTFTATSAFGGIDALSATLDGKDIPFVATGLGELVASGTLNLSFSEAGEHKVTVSADDNYGTTKQDLKFTVVVVTPDPVVTFTAPVNGTTVFAAPGASTTTVPFNFSTACQNGFVADAVNADLDGTPVPIDTTLGLGTSATVSTGTLNAVGAGAHTLSATVTSAGVTLTKTAKFTVKLTAAMPPVPTVTITAPAAGASLTRLAVDPALTLPLTFTATSNVAGGVITGVKATLDGAPLTVTATLGTATVAGNATLSVVAGGTHTLVVSAVDATGTGSTTQTFNLVVDNGRTLGGRLFFDPDRDGVFNSLDFGLAGLKVALWAGNHLYFATTGNDGTYLFTNLPAGSGYVAATPGLGLIATKGLVRTVTIGSTPSSIDFGLMLDFRALRILRADGFSTAFWTTNLKEAVAPTVLPAQVPAATVTDYTGKIGTLALAPFDNLSTKAALGILTSKSTVAADQLSAQLLAAEYNYERGGYISGNRTLSFVFVWWGEYVLSHPQTYTSTDMLWVKDWFAAYNGSRGGFLTGPADTAHRFSTW